MAHIKSRATVVGHRVKLVRDKTRGTGSAAGEKSARASSGRDIAVGVAQSVKAEQGKRFAGAHARIQNQLVLAKDSTGLVLINILARPKRTVIGRTVPAQPRCRR